MLTRIWSETIFCYFRPFFALLPHYWPRKLKFGKNVKNTWRYYPFTHVYHKWQSYNVWFLRYEVYQTEPFCHFGPFFVLLRFTFYPPNSPKSEKFKKMKKAPGDITILHKCIKHHDMLYCFCDMVHDRCNCYFSFWAIFCPFTPLTAPKMKISEKWKKAWRYHHFTQLYQKSWSYAILFLTYGVRQM